MKQALYKGPDISKHNGNVNIKRVRDAGYKRIGIRAGYGKNNVDEKYVSNALASFNLAVQVRNKEKVLLRLRQIGRAHV